MYKKLSMTIIVLLVMFAVIFNSVAPVFSDKASFTKNDTKDTLGKIRNDQYRNAVSRRKYDVVNFKGPILVSHRGANKIAPENSIPAIDEAGKMGYWGVEMDVCSSSDGVLYLMHDGTLNRTTNGKGPIIKKTSAQINKLRIDKGPNIALYPDLKIPRFEDALTECAKYNLVPIFEFKALSNRDRDINTFIRIVRKHGYEKKLLVHSFHFDDLQYLRSKDKEILAMPIVNLKNKAFSYQYIKDNGFDGLDCDYKQLTKKIVEKAHRDGLKVFCWTVDNKSAVERATDMGADFICTDNIYPDKRDKQL